ncbi:MAG: hypothetical protein H7328_05085 [Bdellovibrio sp.]|nr:hypothetical protein [Bdellovibrio sp.]
MNIRMGMVTNPQKISIDPAKIDTLDKAILCDNLYARLITYDDATPKSWLAKTFFIKDNNIFIELQDSLTSNGTKITAQDVAFSLKRLLSLDTNTHAKLDKFLSCSEDFKNINDPCDSIEIVDEKNLILHTISNSKAEVLLKILASTEYGIVPKSAVDPKSLKITDYTNTTGAFSISSFSKNTTLKKNTNFTFSLNFPDTVEIIGSVSSDELLNDLIDNKIDLITTSNNISAAKAKEFESTNIFNIFYTNQIKLFMIAFGPKIISTTSSAQRTSLINKIREILIHQYPLSAGTDETDQFLTKTGDGRLSSKQKQELTTRTSEELPIESKYIFHTYKGLEKSMSNLKNIENLDLRFEDDFPLETTYEKRPSIYFLSGDMAFNVNYSLLSYYLGNQIVAIEHSEAEQLLEKFLNTESEDKKQELINMIHFKILNEALVGPLFVSPYTIITRAPYESFQSKLSASTKLWKISKYAE